MIIICIYFYNFILIFHIPSIYIDDFYYLLFETPMYFHQERHKHRFYIRLIIKD